MPVPDVILDAIESLHLPSPPQVVLRFLHLAMDEQCSIAELAELVGQDPALCAHVFLAAAPTALQRGSGPTRITQCLMNLGSPLTRVLASTLAVRYVFSPPVCNQHFEVTGFWAHSLRIAEMCRQIATAVNYPDVEEAYLSGLLHDIGQLLLLGGMGERYGTLLELSLDESILRSMEEKKLGADHSEIGAWLVEQWDVPSFMADSILFHHHSAEEISAADTLSRIVWSAHAISNHYAPETPQNDTVQSIGREAAHVISDHYKLLGLAQKVQSPGLSAVYSMIGIDSASAFEIQRKSSEGVASIAAALGIAISADLKPFPSKTILPLDSLRIRMHDGDPADSLVDAAVRDLAMLQSLQHDLARFAGESDILNAVRVSARVLFGLGNVAFLMVQTEKALLSGAHVDGQSGLLQHMEIFLDASLSLAAGAALGKLPRSTFDTAQQGIISLADIQIARALGSEGLLYLPMNTRTRTMGVMAFGIGPARSARFQKQLPWMSSLAQAAAISIDALRGLLEREHSREVLMSKRFEQQTRTVIHETGNPLSIISNYLAIVRSKLPDQNNVLQELDILSEEINRVTDIVRSMGSMTKEVPAVADFDINQLIMNMLVLYGDSLFSSRGIKVETSLDPRRSLVSCSRDSVKQILVNLWNNASDAQSDGGCLIIATDSDVNQNGRSYLEIRVSDNGPGLPQDVIQQLYQPLPQNRRTDHSGVGLSIVAALVEQFDGRITCWSKAGQGTTFSILLPQLTKVDT